MGGNSLSLLCRLYAEEAYRKILDELKQGKDSFQRLNLSGADLRFMDFRGCNFSYSVLDEADFSFAQLASAIFDTAQLHGIKYQEHGDIVACAFAGTDPLKVVACTETGGLLVYCLDDDSKTSVKAHTPFSVTEVRVRGQFVFTAGKDNNVICYDITNKIEERWRMPLQSTAHIGYHGQSPLCGDKYPGCNRIIRWREKNRCVIIAWYWGGGLDYTPSGVY